jgi:hypothetical protein
MFMRRSGGCGFVMMAMLLVGAGHSCADAVLTQTFISTNHGFSISLPEGWKDTPSEVREQYNLSRLSQQPLWNRTTMGDGYEMADSGGLPFPARIMTSISGFPLKPKDIYDWARSERLPGAVGKGEFSFNPKSNLCLVKYPVSTNGVEAEWIWAMFLRKKDVLIVVAVLPKTNLPGLRTSVDQVFNSVRIDEKLKLGNVEPPPSRFHLPLSLLAIAATGFVLWRAKPARQTSGEPGRSDTGQSAGEAISG